MIRGAWMQRCRVRRVWSRTRGIVESRGSCYLGSSDLKWRTERHLVGVSFFDSVGSRIWVAILTSGAFVLSAQFLHHPVFL